MYWLFEHLFTGWRHGRLSRVPYACLMVGLAAAGFLAQHGLLHELLKPPEIVLGAPPPSRLEWILQRPLVSAYWIIGLIAAASIFLTTIKRVRDMGLPVFLTLVLMVALVFIQQAGGNAGWVANYLNFLICAGLLFIPGDWFRRSLERS